MVAKWDIVIKKYYSYNKLFFAKQASAKQACHNFHQKYGEDPNINDVETI